MKFKYIVADDGTATAVDAATGLPIDWADSLDYNTGAGGPPILYIGTTRVTAVRGGGGGPDPSPSPSPAVVGDAIGSMEAASTAHFRATAAATAAGDTLDASTASLAATTLALAATVRDFVASAPAGGGTNHGTGRGFGINVLDHGVKGDGVADDGPAIQAVLDAYPGHLIYFPRTATSADAAASYYLGSTLTVPHPGTTLVGDGGGYQGGTVLRWAARVPGLRLVGAGSTIRDMTLFGSEPWTGTFHDEGVIPAGRYAGVAESIGASAADGIRVGAPYCRLENLTIQYWGRDGINASAGDQGQTVGLGAEDCQFDRVFLGNNRGNGLRIQGGDSNCTLVNKANLFVNQYWGIDNGSFLAAQFNSPQATQNGFDGSEQLVGAGDAIVPIAGLSRTSHLVTLTWESPYAANDGTPLRPGDGVRVIACPGDPSFVGRWRVLSVAPDRRSLTYTQVAPDAATTATGSVGRGNYLPADHAIASAVRANGVVTLAFAEAPTTIADGHTAVAGKHFVVGQGVSLLNCDVPTFDGTFAVLSVSPDGRTLTYAQPGPDAALSSGTARMAIPFDLWQLAYQPPGYEAAHRIQGGSFNAPFNTAPQVWINPYAEGGQRSRFCNAALILCPTWSDDPDYNTDNWTQYPLIIAGTGSGTGNAATNKPMGVVWAKDMPIATITRIGATAAQPEYDYWQSPDGATTYWRTTRTATSWDVHNSEPAVDIAAVRVMSLDRASGNVTFGRAVATGSGPTASRPSATSIGSQYFDTTLAKPVWWTGSAWVDASGTRV